MRHPSICIYISIIYTYMHVVDVYNISNTASRSDQLSELSTHHQLPESSTCTAFKIRSHPNITDSTSRLHIRHLKYGLMQIPRTPQVIYIYGI